MIEIENEYLSLIEQGVKAWNTWRVKHPEVTPDLGQAYLFEANLAGANLQNVNLSRACLIGANLRGANLTGANLQGAYASGADFHKATLGQANLSGADLSRADLTDADLSQAQVKGANLQTAQLAGACLTDWQIDSTTQFSRDLATAIASENGTTDETRSSTVGVLKHTSLPVFSKLRSGEPIPVSPFDRDRDWRFLGVGIAIGVGITALTIALLNQVYSSRLQTAVQPTSQASVKPMSVADLPCQASAPPNLSDDYPDYEYENGTQYYGPVAEGTPGDGRGSMIYSNGDRYDGDYRNGKRDGCGTFTFASGRSYVGQFRDDWFDGKGIWTLENGDRYIGEFRNNKCDGRGTFILADGSTQSGRWENGHLIGSNLSCDRTPLSIPRSVEG